MFIQIAALVASDMAHRSGWDGEIRGILDTPRQLRLFFSNEPDRIHYLAARLMIGEQSFHFLMINNDTFSAPLPCLAPMATRNPDTLPTVFSCIIGRTTLTSASCLTLATGDAVTIDELSLPPRLFSKLPRTDCTLKNDIHLYSGYFALTAEWTDSDDIQIKDRFAMNDSTEQTQTQLTSNRQDVSNAEVPCTIEISGLRMTVAEASSLVPGRILKLNRTINDAVCLMADGQLLCRGQLVEIGKELALEITEVP
ncbi:MAG: FliM/FliN family flagellar motor switch protein [Deltaproteobacteria bacterium]|nr:FliM/FliN family flagellar motor switch protein [Deltaproteobacteria bacterium]